MCIKPILLSISAYFCSFLNITLFFLNKLNWGYSIIYIEAHTWKCFGHILFLLQGKINCWTQTSSSFHKILLLFVFVYFYCFLQHFLLVKLKWVVMRQIMRHTFQKMMLFLFFKENYAFLLSTETLLYKMVFFIVNFRVFLQFFDKIFFKKTTWIEFYSILRHLQYLKAFSGHIKFLL